MDYKALKKIVSSLNGKTAADFPDVAIRPNDMLSQTLESSNPIQQLQPPLWDSGGTIMPTSSSLTPELVASSSGDLDRGSGFQMIKAAFFFKLQRELDKASKLFALNFLHTSIMTISKFI